jgi:EAL domain-containing protein (putative c-di-GMP-specific phosphodiesterase class I)
MRCSPVTRDELAGLAAKGIEIALSDFGSGLFRLARSSRGAVRRVVVAPELVREIDGSEAARTVAAAAIHLAHGLGCTVIAKGVERPEQLEVLRAIGCDAAQGPACGPAMCEDEFLRWVGARALSARLARAS